MNAAEAQRVGQANDTQKQWENLNQQLKDAQTQVQDRDQKLSAEVATNRNLSAALAETGRGLADKKRIDGERQSLLNRLLSVEAALNALKLAGSARAKATIEGSILSLNPQANALTLSLGSDLVVSSGSRFRVERNGKTIAQLRAVSAEKNSSVAQFLTTGPDNFAQVSVGDSVRIASQ